MAEHQQKPTIGRIVHYRLDDQDAAHINQRRAHALTQSKAAGHAFPVHTGNAATAGDVYPMTITRVWGDTSDSAVNGQVLLDGNDVHWVTSATQGEGPRHYQWPTRV
jgi:hypothetical protein